jgi:hypothetical protein
MTMLSRAGKAVGRHLAGLLGMGELQIVNCGLPMVYGVIDNSAMQVGPIFSVLKIGMDLLRI